MAYAAVISVAQILDQLLNTDPYPVVYPKSEMEYLYDKVSSLQSFLDNLSPLQMSRESEVKLLENRIRDVMYRVQDSVEFFISSPIRSSEEVSTHDLEEIRAMIESITETADEIGENTIHGKTSNPQLWRSNSIRTSTSVKGREDDILQLLYALTDSQESLKVISITGSAGIGKTALARTIYERRFVVERFDVSAWATVSDDYNLRDILSSLLLQFSWIRSDVSSSSEDELASSLWKELFGRRYLIVLDDIWDLSLWHKLRIFLPNNDNGSRIIITSRDAKVAVLPEDSVFHHVMRPLDEENSWELLREVAFGGMNYPLHLEGIGRSIVEKCGGIPLSIVVVGGMLSKGPSTQEYWKAIEEDVHGAAAFDEDSYLNILYLSYKNLPHRLRACFLYMAAFQEDTEIPVSKLTNLWVAEGFLPQPSPRTTLEHVAKQHLQDLIDRNLISVRKFSSDGQPKTCSLQGNLRQIAMQECQKEDFFYALKKHTQQILEGTQNQRRISIHNNILMCSQDVYGCLKSIVAARTLLYAGLNHDHPLPLCLTFELLRVLDAFTVYFVELPNELFELIHLRYLSFTYDEDLPPSISKLKNLLILIVRQHPKIMFRRASILPSKIWDMPQIRSLLISECLFPEPRNPQNSLLFENLQSLSNVNVASCTKEILQKMPNLKKLVTWIEEPCAIQFDLDVLEYLETFKLTVLKPIPGHKIDFQPRLLFPKTLRKLSLSGCGLPWEDMEIIAELRGLEVVKLRELSFHGEKWCPNNVFERLKFLLLESLDLAFWEADSSHFPFLERLIIRHCYQLEEINSAIGDMPALGLIELVDCSPAAVESVECIREEQEEMGNTELQVRIYSSWK